MLFHEESRRDRQRPTERKLNLLVERSYSALLHLTWQLILTYKMANDNIGTWAGLDLFTNYCSSR